MKRRRLKKTTKILAGAAITGTLVLGVTTTSYAKGWFGFGNQKESGIATDTFDFSQNAGGMQNNNGLGDRQGFGGQQQAGTGSEQGFGGQQPAGTGSEQGFGMQGRSGADMQQGFGMQGGMSSSDVTLADSPSEIVTGITTNSAQNLAADTANAVTYVMSDSNNQIKIDTAGTYIITGTCSDGNITVKKNTTGVVLILKDLDLTSTTGATLSCNKYSEVKIIVEGTVTLTDAEDPDDENSTDADTADAFDGAAIKVKDGASVYLTGTGTLNIDASSCKNGIKVGNDDEPSLIIDGGITIKIDAANDAINSAITISKSYEGLEGTIVNLFGGNVTLNASDDGINAANSDGTYASLGYSINITGGTYNVKSYGDGLDSNGNINITGGYTTISSSSFGGEAGIDFDGTCYIADGTVNNSSGISGPDMMPGQMGNQQGMMRGNQSGMQSDQMPGSWGNQNGSNDQSDRFEIQGEQNSAGDQNSQYGEFRIQPEQGQGNRNDGFGMQPGQNGMQGNMNGGFEMQPGQNGMQGGPNGQSGMQQDQNIDRRR